MSILIAVPLYLVQCVLAFLTALAGLTVGEAIVSQLAASIPDEQLASPGWLPACFAWIKEHYVERSHTVAWILTVTGIAICGWSMLVPVLFGCFGAVCRGYFRSRANAMVVS